MENELLPQNRRIESTLVRVTFKAALVCGALIALCDVYMVVR